MIETQIGQRPKPAAEIVQRAQGIKSMVEHRILPQADASLDLTSEFNGLSPKDKADALYEKLMAYSLTSQMIREEKRQDPTAQVEPVDPYLAGEIKVLWQDKEAQQVFTQTYAQARAEARFFRTSERGRRWQEINQTIADTKQVYEAETRRLFLQQVTRPDQISASRSRTARFAKELISLEDEKQRILSLSQILNEEKQPLVHTSENTDVAAHIMYETFSQYRDQLSEGFVWLPSRIKIHIATVEALQNGRWPELRGEAGTGKSEQADAAILALTGEYSTHLACKHNTRETDLIARQEDDPKTGSYELYGPIMQAATGYEKSTDSEPAFKTGRGARLDESGRLGPEGYSIIKEVRQKRTATPSDIQAFKEGKPIDPDKLLHGRPVLPGFTVVLDTNPEGPRYPDRTEPDAAMRRELSYITVDYADQTVENPELYEFMIVALMDSNYHIAATKEELAPAYVLSSRDTELADGRKVKSEEELVKDPRELSHGIVYRLSFAVRSLQDAFNNGNAATIPSDTLRFSINNTGEITISETSGQPLTLTNSTITLKEVRSWMEGFRDRKLKDDPNYQVDTITEWLQLKLKTFLGQVDEIDKDKIEALFNYYHLFDSQPPNLKTTLPLTPKRIGYLSPRVPRPLHLDLTRSLGEGDKVTAPEGKELPEMHQDKQAMLEDGTTILVSPQSVSLNIKEA